MTIYQVSFRSILSITYSPWLVIYKKGMALTIPYSGKPERPRRLNYPFTVSYTHLRLRFYFSFLPS